MTEPTRSRQIPVLTTEELTALKAGNGASTHYAIIYVPSQEHPVFLRTRDQARGYANVNANPHPYKLFAISEREYALKDHFLWLVNSPKTDPDIEITRILKADHLPGIEIVRKSPHTDDLDVWEMFCWVTRNEPDTEQKRLEVLHHCAWAKILHRCYDVFSPLQRRKAGLPETRDSIRIHLDAIAEGIAQLLFPNTNGTFSIATRWGTSAAANAELASILTRMDADARLDPPRLRVDVSLEEFKTMFLTPLPAPVAPPRLSVMATSENSRTETPITVVATQTGVKTEGTLVWQIQFGRTWSDITPAATGDSYVPVSEANYRVVIRGAIDKSGNTLADVASNPVFITVG